LEQEPKNRISAYLQAFIERKGISRYKLAQDLGMHTSKIYRYFDGINEPGMDVMYRLAEVYPDFDFNELFGSLKMMTVEEPQASYNLHPHVIVETVDNSSDPNIVFVDVPAYGGYIQHSTELSFIKELPTFSLPFPTLRNRTLRMFRIKGNSMAPVFNEGGTTIAQWVEDWPRNIKDGYVYVVITSDDILIKEVYNRIEDRKALRLKSYNSEYKDQEVQATEVKEVWRCYMVFNFDLSNPTASLMDRMYRLENEFFDIRKEIALLKK
jgi:phage repressor protein C with HTH and peptisase S24 domain